jgi:adenylate kinase family enzyme
MKNQNTQFISYKKVIIFGAKSSGKTTLTKLMEIYPIFNMEQPSEEEKENDSNILNILI